MGKTIAIINHKGGVGKTTTTANLGKALSMLGQKVLLVDLDPQANLSTHLGVDREKSNENNIYKLITGKSDCVIYNISGVGIIPSHIDLSIAEVELANEAGRELILRETLEQIKNKYDYMLIDCPPSLTLLAQNALTASDEVIVPLEPSKFALEGMSKLNEVVSKVSQRLNKNLKGYKVLVTKVDLRKSLHKGLIEDIRKKMQDLVFDNYIRMNVAIEEAQANEVDVFTHLENSNGATDYMNVAKEIIKGKKNKNQVL